MQPDNTFIVQSLESHVLQSVFGPYASKPEVSLAIAQAIGGKLPSRDLMLRAGALLIWRVIIAGQSKFQLKAGDDLRKSIAYDYSIGFAEFDPPNVPIWLCMRFRRLGPDDHSNEIFAAWRSLQSLLDRSLKFRRGN